MVSGPTTKDTSTVALGLAQIRIGASAANVNKINPQLQASDSIGALATTKFTGEAEYWKLESGFPLLEDLSIPLRTRAMLECEFKEITPANLALAQGKDPASYSLVHSGEIELGSLTNPEYIRMEAHYTFPNGSNYMHIIFPRANVESSVEMDLQSEDNVNVPITITSKRADSAVSGGNAVWDSKPLGRILFT
jgi:hypothetical protein